MTQCCGVDSVPLLHPIINTCASLFCPALQLSVDHKPNNEAEKERIEGLGGMVVWAGTWRVAGILAVSRAFGDRPLKKYVVSTPHVQEVRVCRKRLSSKQDAPVAVSQTGRQCCE